MAFYIGEMKKVRNSFFEAYKDGDYKKAIVLGNKLLQIYAENDDCDCIEYAAGSMWIFCTACIISGIHTSFWGNMTRRSNTMRWH